MQNSLVPLSYHITPVYLAALFIYLLSTLNTVHTCFPAQVFRVYMKKNLGTQENVDEMIAIREL